MQAPRLTTTSLPTLSEADVAQTASPARGRPMINNLVARMRPIPLVHAWVFWHEKPSVAAAAEPSSAATASPIDKTTSPDQFASQLTELTALCDVKGFWSSFNNIQFPATPLRHSYHLFHDKVKPLWEDPRNAHGGCWTFRVPKAQAESVFQTVCLLAIGEQLQQAVHEEGRVQFKDDICGVSFCMRVGTVLIKVWNRDAGHEDGIARIREVVEGNMPEGVRLGESAVFYKPHRAHEGFEGRGAKGDSIDAVIAAVTNNGSGAAAAAAAAASPSESATATTTTTTSSGPGFDAVTAASRPPAVRSQSSEKTLVQAKLVQTQEEHQVARESIDAMESEVDRVKKILEDVRLREGEMHGKLTDAVDAET